MANFFQNLINTLTNNSSKTENNNKKEETGTKNAVGTLLKDTAKNMVSNYTMGLSDNPLVQKVVKDTITKLDENKKVNETKGSTQNLTEYRDTLQKAQDNGEGDYSEKIASLTKQIEKEQASSTKTGEELVKENDLDTKLANSQAHYDTLVAMQSNWEKGEGGADVRDQIKMVQSEIDDINAKKANLLERDNVSNQHNGYVNANGEVADNNDTIKSLNNSIQENEINYQNGKIDDVTYQNTSNALNSQLQKALANGGYEYKQGDDYYNAIKGTGQSQEYQYVDDLASYDDNILERVANETAGTVTDFANLGNQAMAISYKALTGEEGNYYQEAERVQEKANQYRQYALTGASPMEQMTTEVVGSMMPQFIATAIAVSTTGGVGAITGATIGTEVTSNMVTGILGVQNGINDSFEMLQKGYEADEAVLHGTMYGVISYLTEKIGAEGFTKFFTGNVGQSVMGGAVENGVKKALIAQGIDLNTLVKQILQQGKNEALEEIIEGVADDVADTLFNITLFASGSEKREGVELAGYDGNGFSLKTAQDAWMQLGKEGLYAGLSAGLMGVDGGFKAIISNNAEYEYWSRVAEQYENIANNSEDTEIRDLAKRAYVSVTNEMDSYKQNSEIMSAVTEITNKTGESVWDENAILNTLAKSYRYDIQKATEMEDIIGSHTQLIQDALKKRGLVDWNTDLKLGDDTMATAEYVSRMAQLATKNVKLVDVEFDKEGKYSKSTYSPSQYLNMTREQEVRLAELQNKLDTVSKGNIDIQYSNNVDANGFYSTTQEDGKPLIVLNPNVDENMALELVAMHEFVHSIEGTQEYENMKNIVFPQVTAQGDYMRAEEFMKDIYDEEELNNLLKNGNYNSELMAEIVSRKFFKEEGSKAFIDHMVKYNTSGAYKLFYNLQSIFGNGDPSVEGYRTSKLQRELTNALAKSDVVYNPDGTSFSKSKSTRQQIKQFFDNFNTESKSDNVHTMIPLKDYAIDSSVDNRTEWEKALGLNDWPALMPKSTLSMTQYDTNDESTHKYKINKSHTTGGTESWQNDKVPIAPRVVVNTDVLYQHPYAVFKSKSKSNPNSLVLMLKATDIHGTPLLMTVNLDPEKVDYQRYYDYEYKWHNSLANVASGFYSKSNYEKVSQYRKSGVADWLSDMDMLWSEYGKTKDQVMDLIHGLQLSATGHTMVDPSIAPLFKKSQQYDILEAHKSSAGVFTNKESVNTLNQILGTRQNVSRKTRRYLERCVNSGRINAYFVNDDDYKNGTHVYLNLNDAIKDAGGLNNVKAYSVPNENLAFVDANNAYVAITNKNGKAMNYTENLQNSKKLNIKNFGHVIKAMQEHGINPKTYQKAMMATYTSEFDKENPDRWFDDPETKPFMKKFNAYSDEAEANDYSNYINDGSITEYAMSLSRELKDYFADLGKVKNLNDIPDNIIQKMAEMDYVGNLIPQETFTDEQKTELENAYVDKYYKGRARGRRLDILIGPAGAGKSASFQDNIVATYNSANNDDDLMKEFIDPGYNRYEGIATPYAGASGDILENVKAFGFANGYNMLVQGTGKTPSSLIKWIEIAKQNGYTDIFLWSAETTSSISLRSAIDRFNNPENGRWTPLGFAFNDVGDNPAKTYEILKNYEGVLEGEQKFRYEYYNKRTTDQFQNVFNGGSKTNALVQETQGTISEGDSRNERLRDVAGINSGRYVANNVAPFRKQDVSNENYDKLVNDTLSFRNNAYEIAKEMGINVMSVEPCIGTYNGDNELSFQIETNADIDTNERFASLLGDTGYEPQEAVISSVRTGEENANASQFVLQVKDVGLAIKQINELGLGDNTVVNNKGEILFNIYHFDENNNMLSRDEIDNKIIDFAVKLEQLGDNVTKNEYYEIDSRYLGQNDRTGLYDSWKQEIGERDQEGDNDNLKALRKRIGDASNIVSNKGKVKFSKSKTKASSDAFINSQEEYLPKGEQRRGTQPNNNVNVVASTKYGDTRLFTRTIEESSQSTPIGMRRVMDKAINEGKFAKHTEHDSAVISKAWQSIQSDINELKNLNGKNLNAETIEKKIVNKWMNNADRYNNVNLVKGELLVSELASHHYYDSALKVSEKLAEDYTEVGRALRSARIFKVLTPEGKLRVLENEVASLNKRLRNAGRKGEAVLSTEDKKEYLKLLNDKNASAKDIEAYEEKLKKKIIENVPSTIVDKLNSWRYISMLGNIKTIERNVIGNTISVAMSGVKDSIKTLYEATYNKVSKNKLDNKTASILNRTDAKDQARLKLAGSTFDDFMSKQESTGKYKNDVLRKDTNFKTKPMQTLEKGVTWAMNNKYFGDTAFVRARYTNVLAQYMKANGMDEHVATDSEEFVRAQEYAWKEAERSAFHEANSLARALNGLGKGSKVAGYIKDSIIPFTTTPLNVARQGINYSPLGFSHVITDFKKISDPNSDYTMNDYLDYLAQATTGTGVFLIGAFLAKAGLLRTKDDDKDKKNDYEEDVYGEQDYSIKIGDASVTVDWATPAILPLALGAEINNALGGEINYKNLASIAGKILDPLSETTMLSSLQSALKSYGNKDGGEVLSSFIAQTFENYALQYIPTIWGQVKRGVDNTRYDANHGNETEADRFLKTIQNKTGIFPFGDIQPYVNSKGEYGKNSPFDNVVANLAYQLLSPGYISVDESNAVDDEMERLYSTTGEDDVFPSDKASDYSYNGETTKLYNEDYTKFNADKRSEEYKRITEFVNSSEYSKLSDTERAQVISKIRGYGTDYAKDQQIDDYAPENSSYPKVKEAQKVGTSVFDYYLATAKYESLEGDEKKSNYVDYLNDSSMSDDSKWAMYGVEYSKSKVYGYLNDMDLDSKTKLSIAEAMSDTDSDYDENGDTISNSKAKKLKALYTQMGVYDDIVNYVKTHDGVSWSSFGLSKTIVGSSDTSSKTTSTKKSTSSTKLTTTSSSKSSSSSSSTATYADAYKKVFGNVTGSSNGSSTYSDAGSAVRCSNCGNTVVPANGKCPICGANL